MLYNLLTKVMLVKDTGHCSQYEKQVGFPKGFSYMDHIQTVLRITEVFQLYRLPLVLAFVNYEKAFHNAEMDAVLLTPLFSSAL